LSSTGLKLSSGMKFTKQWFILGCSFDKCEVRKTYWL
jgi:hypothetical protein